MSDLIANGPAMEYFAEAINKPALNSGLILPAQIAVSESAGHRNKNKWAV